MPRNSTADRLITALNLAPLPGEGGYFRATWRNATGSAIYFLLTPEDFSAFHRIAQDEIWHFYTGDPVEHVQLDPRDGSARITRLGPDVLGGEVPQRVVPANVWQGARLAVGQVSDLPSNTPGSTPRTPATSAPSHGFALFGCTLSPPWDERSFELGERAALMRTFPAHAAWIRALTR